MDDKNQTGDRQFEQYGQPQIPTPNPVKPEPPVKKTSPFLALVYVILGLLVFAVAAFIVWAIVIEPMLYEGDASTSATGATCDDGTRNALPTGFIWYENDELGYKFAYPSSWGTVTVSTDPTGGISGQYLQGSFSQKTSVTFGGNATDYVVNAREGTPLDNPGFLQAGNNYYAVQIWQLYDSATGISSPSNSLDLIDKASSTPSDACNTQALTTQYAYSDFYGYSYDLARINLQPTNVYYGVNFLLKNPSSTDQSDMQTLISTFQTL